MDESTSRPYKPRGPTRRVYLSPKRDAVEAALVNPLTMTQLAAFLGISERAAGEGLLWLKKHNRAYIVRWNLIDHGHYDSLTPVYLAGQGKNAQRPKRRTGINGIPADKRELCLAALREAPGTLPQIAKRSGVSMNWVYTCVRLVRDSVHICAWEAVGNRHDTAAVYQWGPGDDAPKPIPVDRKTRQAIFREKSPEKIKTALNKHRQKKKREYHIFSSCFAQLIGADKPRKPMKDFATPEPDDNYEELP